MLSSISRKSSCQTCYTGLRKTIKTPAELRDWESSSASVSRGDILTVISRSWGFFFSHEAQLLVNQHRKWLCRWKFLRPRKWRDLRQSMTQFTYENHAICFCFSNYFNWTSDKGPNAYIFVIVSTPRSLFSENQLCHCFSYRNPPRARVPPTIICLASEVADAKDSLKIIDRYWHWMVKNRKHHANPKNAHDRGCFPCLLHSFFLHMLHPSSILRLRSLALTRLASSNIFIRDIQGKISSSWWELCKNFVTVHLRSTLLQKSLVPKLCARVLSVL